MIFVARCNHCGCAITFLEIHEDLIIAEQQRKRAIVEKWRAAGASISEQTDPLTPDELGIHAPGCLDRREYRRESTNH